ncbi:hypothetical protein JCM8547_003773 [Rhodosporidiobolus lusitaniae]
MASDATKTNLNVRDALSYLDRVKLTFADQTEVYDRFLTIMKDFKSQGIDTPGVIDRVSTLFRGHPGLIQGFNTFLPPGYRIECNAAQDTASGVTTITVTTPMGMTTRTQLTGEQAQAAAADTKPDVGAAAAASATPAPSAGTAPQSAAPAQPHLQSLPPASSQIQPTASGAGTPQAASVLSHQPAPPASSQVAPPAPSAPAPATGAPAAGGDAARPPMEFNHAINYVNKIKNRFIREPETYKAFLEILQTYQKEGRAIQDVYAQVTTLFHTAPDLLDEFKQFLPDTSPEGQAAAAAEQQQRAQQQAAAARAANAGAKRAAPGAAAAKDGGAKRAKTAAGGAAAGKGAAADKSKGKRKADGVTGSPVVGAASSGRKAAGDAHSSYLADPSLDPHSAAASAYYYPSSAAAAASGYAPGAPAVPAGPPPVYAYDPPAPPPPPTPLLPPKPTPSQPDLAFFARVKAHAKDPVVYHEFLKLLNLYTQELIDLTALVSRAWLFLHQDAEVWSEFKEIVGWTDGVEGALEESGKRVEVVDGRRIVENVPRMDGENWRKSRGDAGKRWATYGPSYRKLPPEEISLNCSGRDALCWEVLNDEWVSQPSYASDEGFVAQRKNPYEEALHRSEEERHEYDYHIEANLRTIALLEPIATRIALMEPEERATFRLKPGLGNQSKSIYQRVIKKVYGKEQGLEVIQALHENPCVAVPIVLARLKQKDEEWKRALREWNRVWRESDAKNFLKSLDHQAISLKANDKRFLTTKALVSEIEAIKRTQSQRQYGSHRPSPPPRFQLEYPVSDRQAVFDAARLLFSFLDRTYVVSFAEKPKVDAFLHEFLALAFALPPREFELETAAAAAASSTVLGGGEDDDLSLADGASDAGTAQMDEAVEAALASGSAGTGPSTSKNKKKPGDLRKKALRKTVNTASGAGGEGGGPGSGRGRKKATASTSAPSSRAGSPAASAAGGADGDSVMAEGTPAEGSASREGSLDPAAVSAALTENATPEPAAAKNDVPGLIVPVEEKPVKVEGRRVWNLFGNSTLYNILRLFQILQSRLALLRSSAAVLSVPPKPQPITESHVPSLSMALTYAPPSGDAWSSSAEHYYQRALAICEKLFEGEIDQPTFEDALRRIMATQGYVLFTVDKIVTSILKLSHTACTDPRTRELVELLRQDRSTPDRSSFTQQLFYRTSAEATLATDENFYRIEWAPRPVSSLPAEMQDLVEEGKTPIDGMLRFQLMGKDAVGPEDLPALEREWAKYVQGYVKLDKTPNLPLPLKTPYLSRNLRHLGIPPPLDSSTSKPSLPANLLVLSGLQTRICLRSYKLFFSADTEDVLLRRSPQKKDDEEGMEEKKTERRERKVKRVEKWVEKRVKELEGLKEGKKVEEQKKEDQTPAAASAVAPEEKMEVEAAVEPAKEEKEKEATPAAAVEEPKKEGEDVEMKA